MKKKYWFSLVLSILAALAWQNCSAEPTQTTLPLKFSQDLPSTTIEIQGKTIPLLFDIGASNDAITLSPRALRGLNVRFTGGQTCAHTVSGRVCMKNFIIPELKIGDFTVQDIQGELMPKLWDNNNKGFIQTAAAKNGVIGLKLLQRFGILIDYSQAQVILTKNFVTPSNYNITDWTVIPFEFKGGISTQAQINGNDIRLVWDTGAVPSAIKTSALINIDTNPCPPNKNFGITNCRYIKTSRFTINNQSLNNTWFLVENIPLPFGGLVGSNFFQENLVFINSQDKTLAIKDLTP